MRGRLAGLLLLSILAACAYAVYSGRIRVPDEWNPWAPLRIDEPLHWLTRLKLSRLSENDALCLATLAQAPMRFTPVPDRETGPGCGFDNAVRIERTSVAIGEPFTLSCRSAVALALWERHVVHPAAQDHFAQRVDSDGQFLRALRDGACRVFDSVLGPDYNAAHRNHFHLDRGGYRVCR